MNEKFKKTFQIVEGTNVKTVEMEVNLWQDVAIRQFNLLFYTATDGQKNYIIHESGYVLGRGFTPLSAQESAKEAISNLQYKSDLGCRIQAQKRLLDQCLNLQKKSRLHS